MGLLKRMGLFADNVGVRVTRATSADALCEAYRLVHDVFVQEKYIRPQQCGMRMRPFEALPGTATFIARLNDRVVGVQSLVLDSPYLGLPSDESFRQELDGLRGPGRRVCEATNEAVVEACRRSPVPTELMRCLFAHAVAVGCNELITTVSPGHAKFYGLLGFEQISPVRSYSQQLQDPVVVVRLCMDELGSRFADVRSDDGDDEAFLKRYYIEGNPYASVVEGWIRSAEAAFRDARFLRDLFVDRGRLLPRCSPEELQVIRRAWGDDLFEAVTEPRAAGIGLGATEQRHKPAGRWRTYAPGTPVAPLSSQEDS